MPGTQPPLTHLSPADRARSVVAAGGSLIWNTDAAAGSAPFYEQYGSPMLLATDETAAELLAAGRGRVLLDLHPHVGIVELSGRFWSLATHDTLQVLEALRRSHETCPRCTVRRVTRVIGLQVTAATLRLPGDPNDHPISLDDYELAGADPMVAVGINLAAHLNTHHPAEISALAAALLRIRPAEIAAAYVGPIDGRAFELSILDESGAHVMVLPLERSVADPADLPDVLHDAIAAATERG